MPSLWSQRAGGPGGPAAALCHISRASEPYLEALAVYELQGALLLWDHIEVMLGEVSFLLPGCSCFLVVLETRIRVAPA